MVFQNYALYPHKTVYDNLAFGLRMRKVPKAEQKRRVEEIARVLGLGDMLQRRPAQLSGGQRQRVAMGRAIVREPKAFLMDEPLSNLDAKLRVQMRAEIARIQQALKVTTVYVTHDQVEAMTMGDRVAVMRDGELQQVATPQRLYDAPANLFVASFVGSPPMNLFEAELDRATAAACSAGSATASWSFPPTSSPSGRRSPGTRAAASQSAFAPRTSARPPAGTGHVSAAASCSSSPSARNSSSISESPRGRSSAQTSSTRPPSPQAPRWVATTPSRR